MGNTEYDEPGGSTDLDFIPVGEPEPICQSLVASASTRRDVGARTAAASCRYTAQTPFLDLANAMNGRVEGSCAGSVVFQVITSRLFRTVAGRSRRRKTKRAAKFGAGPLAPKARTRCRGDANSLWEVRGSVAVTSTSRPFFQAEPIRSFGRVWACR